MLKHSPFDILPYDTFFMIHQESLLCDFRMKHYIFHMPTKEIFYEERSVSMFSVIILNANALRSEHSGDLKWLVIFETPELE